MDAVSNLVFGFSVALQPQNLIFCFFGAAIGTLIGVLPGIGPGGALALLLPTTFQLPPATAIIMLAGIYYGAMYGGSTTSILVNIPGEAAAVVTCLDGYQMALRGRAGAALGLAAIGSFVAGTAAVVGLMLIAPPLSRIALAFTSPEYVALILLGLTLLAYIGGGSMLKALMMGSLGLLLGTVGADPVDSIPRFTFGNVYLMDGLGLIPVVMGLFGISEVLFNLEQPEIRSIVKGRIGKLLPTLRDWAEAKWAIVRGTLIGFFVGILPGGNAIVASIISYATERKLARHPERFGTGAIEGVAGPESANNSASVGAFVPLLTLGIPTNAVMALLLASLMIHGVVPGPLLITQNPDIFWGAIASMYVGNAMLLVLNLPLVGIWVQVLRVPYTHLFPLILLFCLIGSYALGNTVFDIVVMIGCGALGYVMRKLDYEPAPLVLAFVLGPMFEDNLRRALIVSGGSFSVFLTRPIAAGFLLVAVALLASSALSKVRARVGWLGSAT